MWMGRNDGLMLRQYNTSAALLRDTALNTKSHLHPGVKMALDLGPLLVFFAANSRWGIFAGTAAFMAAIVLALAVSYALTRRLPLMAIVSGIVVTVFGG